MDNNYTKDETALLFVDPYNDFLSVGGKFWPMVEGVANQVGLLDNLRTITRAIRKAGIQVFIVPHRRSEPSDLADWDHPNPYQASVAAAQAFGKNTWGGEWHPDFAPQAGDVVVKEHWGSSGFAGTDLDVLLRQHRILKVIVVGLVANTCIECTSRFASELGYHVTLVRDATAAFSSEAMKAAHESNGPTFAHNIVNTAQLVASLSRDEMATAASP